jgi:hypothetical protein
MKPELLSGQPLDDIEALVRLASDYVQPSDDLRPRVLEAARAATQEKRAQRRIARVAAVFLLAALSVASISGRRSTDAAGYAASFWKGPLYAPVQTASENNRSGWEMVDSYTELRRHQARLLRLAL